MTVQKHRTPFCHAPVIAQGKFGAVEAFSAGSAVQRAVFGAAAATHV
ncbi:MAG: hypothetical protein U5L46_09110 [Agrobacterium sp.]|nr:hypothetical protein [Agrobacterium sp.]